MRTLRPEPLTRDAFAPYGQVIEAAGADPRPLISIFRGQPYTLPLQLTLVERHPLGSQAFYPLSQHPFLVVVAPDESGTPGTPRAFLTAPGQGINIAMNTWHGVLTPLEADADFLCVDRGGEGNNLEEHFFPEPWTVRAT
jgi:ureidoglycolate lyase